MENKKAVLRSILVCVFLPLTAIIFLEWVADAQFRSARKLEAAYRWQEALAKYEQAVSVDPYNSEYLSGLGDFLFLRSRSPADGDSSLAAAESLYERAVKVDPRDSRNYLMLGLIESRLHKNTSEFSPVVMMNFKSAAANDPNGFNTAYEVGYAGLSLWSRLDPGEKEFVLAKLRYAIECHPEFADYIYPRLWEITRDPAILSQLRPREPESLVKEKLAKLTLIKQRNKNWEETRAFENVNMYWKDTVSAPIYVLAGGAKLTIKASGTPANGVDPYMIVELDGREVGESFVDSGKWKEYSFGINSEGGVKILSVTFANDYADQKSDRNLFIREATVTRNER